MIRRLTLALLLLAVATTAFADPEAKDRHTIIVRNGKVFSSDGGELFRRVYLGFSPLDVSSELREFLGAPKDGGVLVQQVKDGGPAAKAGLRVGDIVTAIDGKTVESAWTIGDLLDDKKAGDSVRLEIIRNHQRQSLMATLEEREPLVKMRTLDIPDLEHLKGLKELDGLPMWRARVEATENCTDLQAKIKELESRLKDLERKLSK